MPLVGRRGEVFDDGGQHGVRESVAVVAEVDEGVDEVVEAHVGLGAAHGEQEAACGGGRQRRGVGGAEPPVGRGEPVGHVDDSVLWYAVGVVEVVTHVDGDGCDVTATVGGDMKAVPLPVDAVVVGGVVQDGGGAGHGGDVRQDRWRQKRCNTEERHVEQDHGEGFGDGQDVLGQTGGSVGSQVVEGGQAAEPGHAGGAVVHG